MINAHAQTKQIEATRLQNEIQIQINDLRKINSALANARTVLLNDAERCKNSNFSKQRWFIDRNSASQDIINQGSGLRYIFGQATQNGIYDFADKYHSIRAICKIDSIKVDVILRTLSTNIENSMGEKILSGENQLKNLG